MNTKTDRAIMRALRVLWAEQEDYPPFVEVPDLRRAVPHVPRAVFDRRLVALEQSRDLILKIANNPRAMSEPDEAILIEGRGPIYYVFEWGNRPGRGAESRKHR